ncbi:MAG: hypothetical protein ACXWDL_10775 [Nocardioides sp.]
MYGDTAVMRRRVSQLREQGTDIRATAAHRDHSAYARRVVAAIEQAVAGDPDARVMLVGSARVGSPRPRSRPPSRPTRS